MQKMEQGKQEGRKLEKKETSFFEQNRQADLFLFSCVPH
jgi:hypothetical protein